jgi:hypothetical protein
MEGCSAPFSFRSKSNNSANGSDARSISRNSRTHRVNDRVAKK